MGALDRAAQGELCWGYTGLSVPNKSYPAMKEVNSLFFPNANPKILACLVHRDCRTHSLKERQMLRELCNPPRQMQKRIWKYPSVFQEPIMGDWLWKKNCWYDLRTQPTVVRQSAHNDGPSKDNTSSILADNLNPNTNNIPMPDYTIQVGRWTWKGNVDSRLPPLLVSTPEKFLCCFPKLLMGPGEMMDVNSSSQCSTGSAGYSYGYWAPVRITRLPLFRRLKRSSVLLVYAGIITSSVPINHINEYYYVTSEEGCCYY